LLVVDGGWGRNMNILPLPSYKRWSCGILSMVARVRLKGTSGVMHVRQTVQGQNHSLVFYFQFPKTSSPCVFFYYFNIFLNKNNTLKNNHYYITKHHLINFILQTHLGLHYLIMFGLSVWNYFKRKTHVCIFLNFFMI
jgi:hypothetical protein